MMYIGAAEYFFYEGIGKGVNNSIDNLSGLLNGKFLMDNPTTRECLEMFELGFYYGLLMDEAEYNELTEEPTSNTISVTVKQKLQSNHLGNC